MRKFLLLFLLVLPYHAFACMNAHIFKIFPVGMCGDTIVTVDIDIWRNDNMIMLDVDDNFRNTIDINVTGPGDMAWTIRTYITRYDHNQKPIETVAVDSVYFQKYEYADELRLLYQKAFSKIISENPDIELFKPVDISFCDLKYKCKAVVLNDDVITYKKKEYPITIIHDSTYHAFSGDEEYRDMMTGLPLPPISSVRKYSIGKSELIVAHLQIGQLLGKKEKPKVRFKDIETTVYEEPILYHGHGYDVFFLHKRK